MARKPHSDKKRIAVVDTLLAVIEKLEEIKLTCSSSEPKEKSHISNL